MEAWSRLIDDQFAAHARLIGIIAAQGAILEAELETLFGTLLGARYNQSKIIYFAMLTLLPRLNIIQSLIADNYDGDEELKKAWNDLRRSIDKASGERNKCVHAVWAENPKTHALQRRTTHSNGKYERRRVDMSVEELTEIGSDLAKVAGQVNQFAVSLFGKTPSPLPNL